MHLWTKPIDMIERFAVFVVLFSAKASYYDDDCPSYFAPCVPL